MNTIQVSRLQWNMLTFIQAHWRDHDCGPLVIEIAQGCHSSRNTVRLPINKLIGNGVLIQRKGMRGLKVRSRRRVAVGVQP